MQSVCAPLPLLRPAWACGVRASRRRRPWGSRCRSWLVLARLADEWVPEALQDGVAPRARICERALKSPVADAICVAGTAHAWGCDHVTVVCGDIVRQPGPGKKTGLAWNGTSRNLGLRAINDAAERDLQPTHPGARGPHRRGSE